MGHFNTFRSIESLFTLSADKLTPSLLLMSYTQESVGRSVFWGRAKGYPENASMRLIFTRSFCKHQDRIKRNMAHVLIDFLEGFFCEWLLWWKQREALENVLSGPLEKPSVLHFTATST